MVKKNRFIPVLLSTIMLTTSVALSGCTDLVATNSKKDMQQVVASVDISLDDSFKTGGEYAKYADVIDSQDVLKRDLVAYFINQGYSMIQNGYSYTDTFNTMLETLVNRKLISQFAKVYFFEHDDAYTLEGYNAAIKDSEHPELDGLKYFLNVTEEDGLNRYDEAVYALRTMINRSLDAQERSGYITETSDAKYESSVRTLPTGVNKEVEHYYDADYRIYTGKNAASACGDYETVDGSTPTTRKKAYNALLSNLKANHLLDEKELAGEVTDGFESLNYWYVELQGQLESALIEKLGDVFEATSEKALTESFVQAKYDELLNTQEQMYTASAAEFETDIDALSDSKFVLYSPESGYGFVYNILLPFSTTQSYELSSYTNDKGLSQTELYEKRAQVLSKIEATDQRGGWLTGATEYAFKASEKDVQAYGASDYLFFENNMLDTDAVKGEGKGRYESLNKYYGHYAYNGTVEYDETVKDYNGYTLKPNKLSIDAFITEMEDYLAFAGVQASGALNDGYMKNVVDDKNKVDYSAFLYYQGKADVDFTTDGTFDKTKDSYTAMSVINELSFAYNTDTAGLNSYLGYAVSAYDTKFVKEFEYAAKEAVKGGVGTYTVAPSDYGWHIMYCTYTFGKDEIYTFNWNDVEKEGTFSYYFYEAIKASTSGNTMKVFQTQVVNSFTNDACIVKYEDRYSDFTSRDK